MNSRAVLIGTEASSPPAAVDPGRGMPVPAIVAAEGDKARERFFTY